LYIYSKLYLAEFHVATSNNAKAT